MAGFNSISLKLKEMYQMITLGGDAELELVDSLDPFSEVGWMRFDTPSVRFAALTDRGHQQQRKLSTGADPLRPISREQVPDIDVHCRMKPSQCRCTVGLLQSCQRTVFKRYGLTY